MFLRSFLLAVALLAPSFAFAESAPKVELGAPYRVVDAKDKLYFKVGAEMVSVKINGDELTIQHFDVTKMTQVSSTVSVLPEGAQLETLEAFDGTLVLFYSIWDKPAKKEQLFYSTLDPKTGGFPAEGSRLMAVDGKVTGTLVATGFYQFQTVDKFRVHRASDEKKLMVEYRKKPESRDDSVNHDVIGVGVFGAGMAELWHKEYRMPYTEEKMDRLATTVDPAGTAYLLAKVREGEGDQERVKGEPNYHVEVLRMEAKGDEIGITPIGFSGKFVQTMAIFDAGAAGLVGAGLYNQGSKRGSADGFFTVSLGKAGVPGTPVFHEIPTEVLAQYANVWEKMSLSAKGKEAELPWMVFSRMVTANDGSVTLIAEQQWVETRTYTSPQGVTSTTYVYHYDDVLVAHVDGKGKLQWMKRIAKHQAGPRRPGGLSFEHFAAGGKQFILYFDNVKNLDIKDDETPAGHIDGAGGFLTAVELDEKSGAATKLSILDSRDVGGIVIYQVGADRIIPISANAFVMEAYKKKKEDVLIRVTLPE